MNAPDPIDNVMIPLDETGAPMPMVTMIPDDVLPNAATFQVLREDHTLGNMIRMQLLEDDNVLFAGYHIRHPLEKDIYVKVQTRGEPKPAETLLKAIDTLSDTVRGIDAAFRAALQQLQTTQEDEYGIY